MSKAKEKQQPYFPHYANSRNEDSMIRLRMEHGVAGYGVYHMLLERLRMSENYQAELDYDILCWDLDCSQELIRSVIYDFGLFEIVCDGQKFQSIELCAYMQLMEEKAKQRSENGQKAAYARYGKTLPVEEPASTPVTEQPMIPDLIEEGPGQDSTNRLDKEIELIKKDETWLDTMAQESGKTKEELISFLSDFKSACVLKGLKGGHKNMEDTFSHYRSWIYKSGRAQDPNAASKNRATGGLRGTLGVKETEALKRLDIQIEERNKEWNKTEKSKISTDLYIRNKGYDPTVVRMVHLAQPGWCEKNPPTHPEWIGKFNAKPVEVPY